MLSLWCLKIGKCPAQDSGLLIEVPATGMLVRHLRKASLQWQADWLSTQAGRKGFLVQAASLFNFLLVTWL